jgi:hypothetical protein
MIGHTPNRVKMIYCRVSYVRMYMHLRHVGKSIYIYIYIWLDDRCVSVSPYLSIQRLVYTQTCLCVKWNFNLWVNYIAKRPLAHKSRAVPR